MSATFEHRVIPIRGNGTAIIRPFSRSVQREIDRFLFALQVALETGEPRYYRPWTRPGAFLYSDDGIRDASGRDHGPELDCERLAGLVRSGALPLDQDRAAATSLAVPVMGWRFRWDCERRGLRDPRPALRAIRPSDRGEEAFVRAYRDAIDAWGVSGNPAALQPFRGSTALGIVPDGDDPFGRHVSYRLVASPGALAGLIEAGELVVGHGAHPGEGA
jgi:hypothetical protein